MIIEITTKMRYEVDEDVWETLDTDEIDAAVIDGKVKIVWAERKYYEDGELIDVTTLDEDDVDNAINEMKGAE